MTKSFFQTCFICLLVTSAGTAQASTLGKLLGTWILNLEKSKFEDMMALAPGTRVVAQKVTIEETDGKLKLTGSTTLSDGRSSPDEISILHLEGSVVTVAPGTTASFMRISDVAFDIIVQIHTRSINSTGLNRFVVSSDGKTLTESKTQISREVVPDGIDPTRGKVLKSSTSVLVFDKLP